MVQKILRNVAFLSTTLLLQPMIHADSISDATDATTDWSRPAGPKPSPNAITFAPSANPKVVVTVYKNPKAAWGISKQFLTVSTANDSGQVVFRTACKVSTGLHTEEGEARPSSFAADLADRKTFETPNLKVSAIATEDKFFTPTFGRDLKFATYIMHLVTDPAHPKNRSTDERVAIHTTPNVATLGKFASHGCVRTFEMCAKFIKEKADAFGVANTNINITGLDYDNSNSTPEIDANTLAAIKAEFVRTGQVFN